MKFTQTRLILGPTSIEDLNYSEDADNDTIAQAMLINWEDHGSLVGEGESWKSLKGLDEDLIFADALIDYDSYRECEFRALIIKIEDRFFAYYYTSRFLDRECYHWEEVKPIPSICYDVKYVSVNSHQTHNCEKTAEYIKLYNQ